MTESKRIYVTMNASIGHARYGKPQWERTFHSLAELLAFIEETGHEVVIGGSGDLVALLDRYDYPLIMHKIEGDGRLYITIYDDYLE